METRCRILLDSHLGEDIQSPKDVKFVTNLLRRHSGHAEKVGCGLEKFSVQTKTNSRCFYIHRTDGTSEDFSYMTCISPATHSTILQKTLRNEIQDQICEFREELESLTCAICGKVPSDSHVDHHEPQFVELVNEFLVKFPKLEVSHDPDHYPFSNALNQTYLKNRGHASKWHEFHRLKANLRLTCALCNLRKRKRGA